MKHRHLNHSNWTLAAIDSCITRGTREDHQDLRAAALADPEIMKGIVKVAGHRAGDDEPENFDRDLYRQWLEWAREAFGRPGVE